MLSRLLNYGIASLVILSATQAATVSANEARIVGGQELDISYVPSTVALINNNTLAQTGSYFQSQICGGTVIAPRWVLTAAHCVVDDNGIPAAPANLSVLMGTTDLNLPANQPVGLTAIIVHESYDHGQYPHDIALLRLEYDSLVPAAALMTEDLPANDSGYIAGWGALNGAAQGPQQYPTTLQGAYVNIYSGVECAARFPMLTGQVSDLQVCGGLPEGGTGSCQGDSGGPLYVVPPPGSQLPLRVAGVVNWGFDCAQPESPTVYASVKAYGQWIARNATGSDLVTVTTEPVITSPEPVVNNDTTDLVAGGPAPATSGGGGGIGWILLLMVGPLLVFRHRSLFASQVVQNANASINNPVVWFSVMGTLLAGYSFHPLSADTDTGQIELILAELPLGQSRETVVSEKAKLWRSTAGCTIVGTGFALQQRRFIETCQFANLDKLRLCDSVPHTVDFRFAKNTLVQVIIELDEPVDSNDDCMQDIFPQENKKDSVTSKDTVLEYAIDANIVKVSKMIPNQRQSANHKSNRIDLD